jgi:hypothetical protein
MALGWRAQRSDGSYDFWVSVTDRRGRTFAAPTRLSTQMSPAPNFYLTLGGDDTSGIALTDDHLYATWGDWRGSSGEEIYLAGLPLPSPSKRSDRAS